MTTIEANNSRNPISVLAALIITAAILGLAGALLYSGPISLEAGLAESNHPRTAGQVDSPEIVTSGKSSALTASQAMATDNPVLFVFVPFEKCSQQYCLTAAAVESRLPAQAADSLHVVEVPVHSFHIYTADAPPDFIMADWDLYPTAPQAEWMPEATLTEFGWGISETTMVLVDSDGELVHDFGRQLDMQHLQSLVQSALQFPVRCVCFNPVVI